MIIHFMSTPFIQDGFTPLHVASQKGHSSVVTILVTAGASVRAVTNVSTNRNVALEQWLIYLLYELLATLPHMYALVDTSNLLPT